MKKNLPLVALAALLIAGAVILGGPLVADDTASNPVTSIFKVEGMTCGGCEVGVRINVKKLDGVDKVEASYEDGRAEVTYDPEKVTAEQIEAAIEKLGYEAELEEPDEEAA